MFFENNQDAFQEIRDVFDDPNHPENYWVLNEEGIFPCNVCDKTYAYSGSLKAHGHVKHQHVGPKLEKKKKQHSSRG